MRRFATAVMSGLTPGAGVLSGVATAQQSSVSGMSSDDLNTALDFARAGPNKAIDQVRACSALSIKGPRDMHYTCEGSKILLVKYVMAGDTPLAAAPLNGKTPVLVSMMTVSGAHYVSGQYVWWTRGPTGPLISETLLGDRSQFYRDCSEATDGRS